MPKLAYRLILGVFLFAFIASSCGNKKTKEEKATEDTIKKKPVDGGNFNEPVDGGNTPVQDTIKKKPVDGGN